MENLETISGELNTLLPDATHGKEEVVIEKSLHERIVEMFKAGKKKKVIARLLGFGIKTVRKILGGQEWVPYRRTSVKEPLLGSFQEWIGHRAPEVEYNGRALFRELKEKGYQGKYDTVRKYLAPLRPATGNRQMTVRFETLPGQQAQVDWGSSQVWFGEERVRIRFFVMTLGYSSRMFVRAFPNERLGALIEAHEEAFHFFGGVTEEVLYDNPKTMVIKREGATVVLNGVFEDFARHWGYSPRFCRPYRPQTKGKVESGVKYVKKNFLVGRRFRDLAHLNEELDRWNREEADMRLHGTTGCRPIDRFSEERLTPCPLVKPYLQGLPNTRQVSREGFVNWKGNRYSVPWSWGPVTVRVSQDDQSLIILSSNGEDVRHALLSGDTGQCRIDPSHHYPEEKTVPAASRSEDLPPQYDPRWEKEEVEMRDLALYDLLEQEVLR